MKKKYSTVFLVALTVALLLVTLQCQVEPDNPQNGNNINRSVAKVGEFADDRILVVMNKERSLDFRKYTPEDFSAVRCSRVEDLTELTMELISKQRESEKTGVRSEQLKDYAERGMLVKEENFKRVFCLTLAEPGVENVRKAIQQLEKSDAVLYAGPDYVVSVCAVPNDPYLGNQWAVNNISLSDAWNITTGSSTAKVGVIDSGIDGTHPDLKNRVDKILNRDFTGAPPAAITNPPVDPMGHGSHVAGIIGAEGDNKTGVTGVCWNVTLVSLKAFDKDGNGYSSSVARAIDFAGNNGIDILNLSARWYPYWGEYDLALAAILNVYPGLFVCAAGNESGNDNDVYPCYPASYILPNFITVGSTDSNDNVSWFSNIGPTTVDLFAPGGYGNFPPMDGDIYSTWNNNTYNYDWGTSMASPYVAGVAALIKSKYPTYTPQQIKAAILDNVEVLPQLKGLCVTGGRLNAANVFVQFAGGSGTPGSPYQITTHLQLSGISKSSDKHFKLMNDIAIPNGFPLEPIPSFSGVFDGQGYTISGLNNGLFAVNRGTIASITIL
jgi:subtilisin family serine protease